MTTRQKRENANIQWFFGGGYMTMNPLQQVEYLIDECGYTDDGAFWIVFGEC